MEKKPTKSEMESLSKRYLPDEELTNPPARLFRGLLNQMKMNPYKWTRYLQDYLKWVIGTSDKEKARTDTLTKMGNIRDAYFHKPKLSADKLFEGLSIIQMEEYEITLKVTDSKGNVYEVTDKGKIKHPKDVAQDEAVVEQED